MKDLTSVEKYNNVEYVLPCTVCVCLTVMCCTLVLWMCTCMHVVISVLAVMCINCDVHAEDNVSLILT